MSAPTRGTPNRLNCRTAVCVRVCMWWGAQVQKVSPNLSNDQCSLQKRWHFWWFGWIFYSTTCKSIAKENNQKGYIPELIPLWPHAVNQDSIIPFQAVDFAHTETTSPHQGWSIEAAPSHSWHHLSTLQRSVRCRGKRSETGQRVSSLVPSWEL